MCLLLIQVIQIRTNGGDNGKRQCKLDESHWTLPVTAILVTLELQADEPMLLVLVLETPFNGRRASRHNAFSPSVVRRSYLY